MSRPPRQPEAWSSDCEAAFHAARALHEPSAADRARVLRELTQRLAQTPNVQLASGAESSVLVPGVAIRTAYTKLAKLGLGLLCVGTGVVAAFYVVPVKPGAGAPPAASESRTSSSAPAEPTAPPAGPETHARPSSVASPELITQRPVLARSKPAKPSSPRRVRAHSSAALADYVGAQSLIGSEAVAQTSTATETPVRAPLLTPHRAAQGSSANTAVRASAPVTASAAVKPGNPREELAFLVRINREMSVEKFQSVLTLCAEHEQRWPHGTFAQEREALRAIAGCGAGARNAGVLARAFLTNHPRTTLAPHVRQACEAQLKTDLK